MPALPVREMHSAIHGEFGYAGGVMIETVEKLASILIVEDDPKQLKLYAKALRGYRLTCVATGTAALQTLAETRPDLVILDNILDAGERGIDFLARLKSAAAHVPVILISGTLKLREQLAALKARAPRILLWKSRWTWMNWIGRSKSP